MTAKDALQWVLDNQDQATRQLEEHMGQGTPSDLHLFCEQFFQDSERQEYIETTLTGVALEGLKQKHGKGKIQRSEFLNELMGHVTTQIYHELHLRANGNHPGF